MLSDDTEHTVMVLRSLLAKPETPDQFQRLLARHLRTWILAVPAGVGLATAKACMKLVVGVPPKSSGSLSAGNGAAMRAAIIGAFVGDEAQMPAFVVASSVITHRDVRAVEGAQLVALATVVEHDEYLARARLTVSSQEWTQMLDEISSSLHERLEVTAFARRIGAEHGVSGYVLPSVAVALYSWLTHPYDFMSCLTELIALGGDTDTIGAIVGGISGSHLGVGAIPAEWLDRLSDWPLSVNSMRLLAGGNELRWTFPARLVRNILFLGVVLTHGFRRLLPPY